MQPLNPRTDCRVKGPGCHRISFEKSECGAKAMQYRSGYDQEPWRHDNGAINVVDYDTNLLPPQRRTFLFPALYNGGCEQQFCNNAQDCPGQPIARTSPETQQMFNAMFGSSDFYGQSTNVSPACSGVKCNSANGPAGWRLGADGQPIWKNTSS